MDLVVALMIVAFLWVMAGAACVDAWKDAFNAIQSRTIRVSARILMLVFWPAWLVIWAVCVAIAVFCMLLVVLFE